ncbi:MAG: YbhB/YbcL family Raf kinase inhibitor-like protein [Candidatus Omnitrophica bacterium]|nr:YbhB/YbcL family Raf kinase inhibitor-like protein [Candidatus Omnitrophota bacterium]MDD5042597.1 YbhB/YbcL family Raf kinase inhibitor-like protein [Candidatus Omnitrophota bacterium]MDD5500383.1 YbhB/YbcL family Raf kinase inhibitor-like protein [Candidatus Omnitrophota bacterium]
MALVLFSAWALFAGSTVYGEASMKISSPEFEYGSAIPAEFTCQGKGVNPPLSIDSLPPEAKTLVLIVDDPDAPGGDFVHWVVYDIPAAGRIDIEKDSVPGRQGVNSAGRLGYISPCPPSGTHRYFFKIYALGKELALGDGLSKRDIEEEMKGSILDKAELMGLYRKK